MNSQTPIHSELKRFKNYVSDILRVWTFEIKIIQQNRINLGFWSMCVFISFALSYLLSNLYSKLELYTVIFNCSQNFSTSINNWLFNAHQNLEVCYYFSFSKQLVKRFPFICFKCKSKQKNRSFTSKIIWMRIMESVCKKRKVQFSNIEIIFKTW